MSGLSLSVTTSGLDRIIANLEKKELESRVAIEKAILRLALLIERIAKDEYVPVVSGRLKASIGGQSSPKPFNTGDAIFETRSKGTEFEVFLGSNVIYAAIIEFGRNPQQHPSARVRREFAQDHSAAKGKTKLSGNGRHGPFLRPALNRAMVVGMPVIRAMLKTDLGLI